jgi:hypothetical protein
MIFIISQGAHPLQWAGLYRKETEKPLVQSVKDLKSAGESRGFIIHNESEMGMAL